MVENNATASYGKKGAGSGVSIRVIGAITIVIGILLAFNAFTLAGSVANIRDAAADDEVRYVACSDAVDELQEASDYLTTQARMFIATGRRECMDAYLNELNVVNRRGKSVETLQTSLVDDLGAATELENALAASDELAKDELAAMRLAADYYQIGDVPDKVANADISHVDVGAGQEAKLEAAKGLLFDANYDAAKQEISESVEASLAALLTQLTDDLAENEELMQNLLFQLRISVALLLCTVMVLVLVLFMYVLKPLDRYIKRIEKNEPLQADGAYELRYLAEAYNAMYEDNSKRIEQLREIAERDPLTGLSNRSGYDNFLATHTRNIALVLIDIDNFKEFNNVYGRDTGNAVMLKLASALSDAFRSTDFPCRIESDKFAVIMTNMHGNLREAVLSKMELVNALLADSSDDTPLITLSVGAAFSTEGMTDQDIYHAANEALIQAQQQGTNNIVFYGEGNAAV